LQVVSNGILECWNVGIMGIGLRLRRDLSPLEHGVNDNETIALK
jgi:hypothetical protein